jgi:hypothetical protein
MELYLYGVVFRYFFMATGAYRLGFRSLAGAGRAADPVFGPALCARLRCQSGIVSSCRFDSEEMP